MHSKENLNFHKVFSKNGVIFLGVACVLEDVE